MHAGSARSSGGGVAAGDDGVGMAAASCWGRRARMKMAVGMEVAEWRQRRIEPRANPTSWRIWRKLTSFLR